MALKKAKLVILMADDDPEDRMLVREAFGGKPVKVLSVEDGVELLEYLTTSQQECDVRKCYEMGANTYIVKPLSYDKLVESMDSVHLYWTNVAKLPAQEARSNCKNGAGIA